MGIFKKAASVVIAAILLPFSSFALEYKLIDLGTLEAERSEAVWINENGEVLGKYTLDKHDYPFIWTEADGLRTIDLQGDVVLKQMNNAGQILGFHRNEEERTTTPFLWDPVEGFFEITSESASNIQVYDLNDSGMVVGSFFKKGVQKAFVWDKGELTELPSLFAQFGLPAKKTEALSINNDGDIVGYSLKAVVRHGKVAFAKEAAVLWRFSTQWKLEQFYPDSVEDTQAFAINNLGKVLCRKTGYPAELININDMSMMKLNYSPSSGKNAVSVSFNDKAIAIDNSNSLVFINESDVFTQGGEEWCSSEKIHLFNRMPFDFWKHSHQLTSVNSQGWVVGSATTVFNEKHAFLFIPEEPKK